MQQSDYYNMMNRLPNVERYYYKYESGTVWKSNPDDRYWIAHYMIYKYFLRIAKNVPTLDLCCGCGAGTKLVAETIHNKIVGVDYSADAIQFAKIENSNGNTIYYKTDLNTDLQSIKQIIQDNDIEQIFFIEGIEHIQHPFEVVQFLIDCKVKTIFISTPHVPEHELRVGHHISVLRPSEMKEFCNIFSAQILSYFKFVSWLDVQQSIHQYTEDEIIDQHTTTIKEQGINYLIKIEIG